MTEVKQIKKMSIMVAVTIASVLIAIISTYHWHQVSTKSSSTNTGKKVYKAKKKVVVNRTVNILGYELKVVVKD